MKLTSKGTHQAGLAVHAKKISFRGSLWTITKVERFYDFGLGQVWFYIQNGSRKEIRVYYPFDWVTVSFK